MDKCKDMFQIPQFNLFMWRKLSNAMHHILHFRSWLCTCNFITTNDNREGFLPACMWKSYLNKKEWKETSRIHRYTYAYACIYNYRAEIFLWEHQERFMFKMYITSLISKVQMHKLNYLDDKKFWFPHSL